MSGANGREKKELSHTEAQRAQREERCLVLKAKSTQGLDSAISVGSSERSERA